MARVPRVRRAGERSRSVSPPIAAALIVGGMLGNTLDRIRFGVARDFLTTPWAIVNLADIAVASGHRRPRRDFGAAHLFDTDRLARGLIRSSWTSDRARLRPAKNASHGLDPVPAA